MSAIFTLEINYDGHFVELDRYNYVGGTKAWSDVDSDLMSYYDIVHFSRRLGCSINSVIYFKMPNMTLDDGLVLLDSDKTVLKMFKVHKRQEITHVSIYIDDPIQPDAPNETSNPTEPTELNEPAVDNIAQTQTNETADPIEPLQPNEQPDPNEPNNLIGSTIPNEPTDPNMNEKESSSEDDISIDFEFFAEGDTLSDSCDPIGLNENVIEIEGQNDGDTCSVENDEIQSDPGMLDSLSDSDNEHKGPKFLEFNEQTDMTDQKLKIGLIFGNVEIYRKALRQHAIKRGFELIFEKNERHRVTVKCKNLCGWRIHASFFGKSTSYQIKSLVGEPHRCPRVFKNMSANSRYLSNTYLQNFVDDPNLNLKAFGKLVRKDLKLQTNRQQLYRAKKKSLETINGSFADQYHRLREYCYMVLENNPGNVEEMGWSFISDGQKGLVETFETLIPNAEHRYCVRHLYANFKLKFKDKALKDLMWAAASSFVDEGFKKNMDKIKAIDPNAHTWLSKIPNELWCKHKMSGRAKCDLLSNNICESFNNFIKEAREQSILTLLEMLRRQMMSRFQKKRDLIEKYSGALCPRIVERLEKIKDQGVGYEALLAGDGKWEIMDGNKSFVVDLNIHTCACREWDITRISCAHATCALLTNHIDPAEYVSPFYSVALYKAAYSSIICPIPHQGLWPSTDSTPLMPPPFKKLPGRPRKLRKKGADEISDGVRVTRIGRVMYCSNCGESNHNKKGCKNPPKQASTGRDNLDGEQNLRAAGRGRGGIAGTNNTSRGRGRVGGAAASGRSGIGRVERGRSRKGRVESARGRLGRGIGRGLGPNCGLGNWNEVEMINMQSMCPNNENVRAVTENPSSLTQSSNNSVTNVQIQRIGTRFGDTIFASQSSSNKFSVITDFGESKFEKN